jgi:hypothetical protein
MQRKTSNESFEQFLRQNAEEFKIYPSTKAWNSISKKLNKTRRKFYFGFALFTIAASLITLTITNPEIISTKHTASEKTLSPATEAIPANKPSLKINTAGKIPKTVAPGQSSVTGNEPDSNIYLPGKYMLNDERKADRFGASGIPNSLLHSFPVHPNNYGFDFDRSKNSLKIQDSVARSASSKVAARRKSRLSTMFFITPTISYRKLTENKSYIHPVSVSSFSYSRFNDINNAVTHKPDMGLEFGFATKYGGFASNIKLTGGLQFNINRYDIKAFSSFYEIATIALNNGYGVDSVSALSNHRNFNGNKTDWLENFYFQIAAPVGMELKLVGNNKTYLGIASTVQPTYVIGDRAYLITTDYKNYAKVPWLTRRWNVNTSMETFVSFTNNNLKWQVGPQVRYQLKSSFISKYPVKENLFDFGLKVGISLNQQK